MLGAGAGYGYAATVAMVDTTETTTDKGSLSEVIIS